MRQPRDGESRLGGIFPIGDDRPTLSSGTNGTNGAHPAGLRTRTLSLVDREFDGREFDARQLDARRERDARDLDADVVDDGEPVDLVALQADDELINALAAGRSVSAAGGCGTDADDRVSAVLAAWKAEVDADPVPDLVDTDTAVATVLAARRRSSGRSRHLVGLAAAVAAAVTLIAGVSVGSYSAAPDSVLWPVAKVLYSEKTTSVEAADRAEQRITRAKQAIAAGQPGVAEQELRAAAADIDAVRPAEGRTRLVDVQSFLVAKAGETTPGVPTDPGAPLARDSARTVPAGAAISRPARTGEQPPGSSGSSVPASPGGSGPAQADPRIAGQDPQPAPVAPVPDPGMGSSGPTTSESPAPQPAPPAEGSAVGSSPEPAGPAGPPAAQRPAADAHPPGAPAPEGSQTLGATASGTSSASPSPTS